MGFRKAAGPGYFTRVSVPKTKDRVASLKSLKWAGLAGMFVGAGTLIYSQVHKGMADQAGFKLADLSTPESQLVEKLSALEVKLSSLKLRTDSGRGAIKTTPQ